MNNHSFTIPNRRGKSVVPQFINTAMVLQMVKGKFKSMTICKSHRQALIRSAIELTEFKGLQLRRWIREVLFFTSII
jgi:hypothetical protein